MIKENMHIHSKYSWDSKLELDVIARTLVENNISYATITDHIEFDKETLADVLPKFKMRNLEINRLNEIYQGKLTIFSGAEISEPNLYKEEVKYLEELDLDLIIGSIHYIKRGATTEIGIKNAYNEYLKHLMSMIEAKQIDVIGHIDYINRYYPIDFFTDDQEYELFDAISTNKQIIEINTSASRRCNKSTFPSLDKLQIYKKIVGDYITIGTDAHVQEELTDNTLAAEIIVKALNLKPVIFEKRKMKELKPPTYI